MLAVTQTDSRAHSGTDASPRAVCRALVRAVASRGPGTTCFSRGALHSPFRTTCPGPCPQGLVLEQRLSQRGVPGSVRSAHLDRVAGHRNRPHAAVKLSSVSHCHLGRTAVVGSTGEKRQAGKRTLPPRPRPAGPRRRGRVDAPSSASAAALASPDPPVWDEG